MTQPNENNTGENTPPGTGEGEDDNDREARYRTERNTAQEEAKTAKDERNTAIGRVKELLHREAIREAEKHLANAADWQIDGAMLEDVQDDNGDIDPAKMQALCREITDKRPGLINGARANQGHGAGGAGNSSLGKSDTPKTFQDQWRAQMSDGRNAQRANQVYSDRQLGK